MSLDLDFSDLGTVYLPKAACLGRQLAVEWRSEPKDSCLHQCLHAPGAQGLPWLPLQGISRMFPPFPGVQLIGLGVALDV